MVIILCFFLLFNPRTSLSLFLSLSPRLAFSQVPGSLPGAAWLTLVLAMRRKFTHLRSVDIGLRLRQTLISTTYEQAYGGRKADVWGRQKKEKDRREPKEEAILQMTTTGRRVDIPALH